MSLIGGKEADFSYEIFKQRLNNREIWLNGKIDEEVVSIVCPTLLKLETENNQPITIYINSQGGRKYEGCVLYDFIESLKSPVYTVAVAKAMSAAFTIFMAGDKRMIYRSTVLLAHTSSFTNANGKVPDLIDLVDFTKKLIKKQSQDFSKKTEKSEDWWNKVLNGRKDMYFTADESLKYGIATDLIS